MMTEDSLSVGAEDAKEFHRLSHESAVHSISPVYTFALELLQSTMMSRSHHTKQNYPGSSGSRTFPGCNWRVTPGQDPCGSKCALSVTSAAVSRPQLSCATQAACQGEEEHCRCSLTHPKPERHLSPALMRMEQCPQHTPMKPPLPLGLQGPH